MPGPTQIADRPVDSEAMHALRRSLADLLGPADPTLGEGIETANRLRLAAEALVTELVVEARASGATWADIGEVLGVSTQAAHQKYRFVAARSEATSD